MLVIGTFIHNHFIKIILIFFIIFTIFLTVYFFWKEDIDTNCKINDEKVGNFFTAFGSVAAAISIFFLYKQLVEMQDARIASQQPDIYPSFTQLFTKDDCNFSNFAEEEKPILSIYRNESNHIEQKIRPYIELHNIGFGAAKNISLKWVYDRSEIINLIKDAYYYSQNMELTNEEVDFIVADGKLNIHIPSFYLNCCGEKLNQSYLDTIDPVDEKPKPKLNLEINYQDTQNNHYKKIFDVSVEAFLNFVELKFKAKIIM